MLHVMHPWTRLLLQAQEQHGAIARRQVAGLGVSPSTFDARVRREAWRGPFRGVRVLPGGDPHDPLTRMSAALLAIGDHALATGWSGLFLHGVLPRAPKLVTLVVPWSSPRRRITGIRIIRSRTLLDDDRDTVSGLATAALPRSFVDAARTDRRARLRILLIDTRQRRVGEPSDVAARALIHPRITGARDLIAAAHDVDSTGADSAFSDAVHRRLVLAGLRPDPHPVTVRTPSGRVLHPDITFARHRVCIEVDSLGFHGTQRGLDFDHRKDQGYRQALWNCLRIGWFRFDTDWPGFERDAREALAAAA